MELSTYPEESGRGWTEPAIVSIVILLLGHCHSYNCVYISCLCPGMCSDTKIHVQTLKSRDMVNKEVRTKKTW